MPLNYSALVIILTHDFSMTGMVHSPPFQRGSWDILWSAVFGTEGRRQQGKGATGIGGPRKHEAKFMYVANSEPAN